MEVDKMDHVDCVVAGAGIVGLAIARSLARAGIPVLVLEADISGAGTSGKGSGVIHAGLYYEPGSLKARLCVAGRDALYAFAAAAALPVRRRGKLVVATDDAEAERLRSIATIAQQNGVDDLEWLDTSQAMALEPALRCRAALLSPSTGVIDATALMRRLAEDAKAFGAMTAMHAPVEVVHRVRGGFTLVAGGATPMQLRCRLFVNAAGHGAPALAGRIEGLAAEHVPRPFLAKGSYFATRKPPPFSHLIYPLPVPGGIGTHLTVDVHGAARFGPDVEWVQAFDYGVDPRRAEAFAADIGRWWPRLNPDDLYPAGSGIRPKISGPGEPPSDFRIDACDRHGIEGLVNLFGIESPGLTASLAIADLVRDLLVHRPPFFAGNQGC